MLPFTVEHIADYNIQPGDRLWIPGIRAALLGEADRVEAVLLQGEERTSLTLWLKNLSREERDIILAGCLINYYAGSSETR